MSAKRLECVAALATVMALAACSNGSGNIAETLPPVAPSQGEPAPTTPTPTPTTPTTPTTPPTTPPPPPTPPPPAPPPPTPPATPLAGYWFGTVEPKQGRSLSGRAIIAGNGDAQLIVTEGPALTKSPLFVVHGNVCCKADVDTELKSARYLSDRSNDARFQVKLDNARLVGKVRIRRDEYDLSLARLARYNESITLAELSGTYTRQITLLIGPSSTYTVTVDPSGQISGSHSNGCIYGGTASLPDAPRNLVKLDIQLSNCPRSITGSGSMNGSYTGMGLLLRDTAAPSDSTQRADVFLHSLVGRTWLGAQPVER
jgi:hypothetical protein